MDAAQVSGRLSSATFVSASPAEVRSWSDARCRLPSLHDVPLHNWGSALKEPDHHHDDGENQEKVNEAAECV